MKEMNGVIYSKDLKVVLGLTEEKRCRNDVIVIEPGTIFISPRAFENSNAAKFVIPESVKYIGKCAFIFCDKIESIVLENVEIIDEGTFKNCKHLNEVIAPHVRKVMESAFAGCAFEMLPNFPVLETIEHCAFDSCNKLKRIFIRKDVNNIYESAFSECRNIEEIIVDPNNEVYSSINNCNAIIDIDRNKLIIGCKNTVIPSEVYSVGGEAFNYSDRKEIIIPEGVRILADEPFYECNNLHDIYLPKSIASFDYYTFNELNDDLVIHYPGTREEFMNIPFADCISKNILGNIKFLETFEAAIDAGKSFREVNELFKNGEIR